MLKYILIFFILLSTTTFAQEVQKENKKEDLKDKVETTLEQAADFAEIKFNESALNRKSKMGGLTLQYSPVDFILPSKFGASFYFQNSEKSKQYEIQYLKSTVSLPGVLEDFGNISDQRISFLLRNFSDNGNFNWYYGISYISLEAQVGGKLLQSVPSNSSTSNYDIFKIQSIGLDLGIGNRWYFNNSITFGVDWIGFSQPLSKLKNEVNYLSASTSQEDKDTVQKAIDLLTYFPRIYLFKLSLGYSF